MRYRNLDGETKITCTICFNIVVKTSFRRHLLSHDLNGSGEGGEPFKIRTHEYVHWVRDEKTDPFGLELIHIRVTHLTEKVRHCNS